MRTIHPNRITTVAPPVRPQPQPAQPDTTTQELKEQPKRPIIALLVPVYGTITALWLIKFMQFLNSAMTRFVVRVFIHEDQPIDKSRNRLIEMALESDAEYFFCLDSDNIAAEQTIDRLMHTMRKTGADLVTAIYYGKDPPYFPVLRKYRSGGFWKIENPELGKQFEIDGCGLGCALIKAKVFRELKEPWFNFSNELWGKKEIQLSEDLYFARLMMQKGMKQVCDSSVVSAHIGGAVDVMEYMNFAPIRQSTMQEREELIDDIVEYTNRTRHDVDLDIMVGPGLMNESWTKANPKTTEDILKFYKETELYLYDLALWHFSERRKFDIELMTSLKHQWDKKKETIFKDKTPKLLDFGCGIGQNSIMLARIGFEVTLADLDSKTLAFTEHRFKKHNVPCKVWKVDIEDMPPEEKYDFILAFDVFEHMDSESMKKHVETMSKIKHPGTEVMMSNSFTKDAGGPGSHPMHFEETQLHREMVNKLLNDHVKKGSG